MEIRIDDKFRGIVSPNLVRDLYREVCSVNPAQMKGVRGGVLRKGISGLNLIIRLYRRGGLVRYFLSSTFLKLPLWKLSASRPVREFEVLRKLSGLPVPIPIAVAVKAGRFTYKGILITKEIAHSQSLLENPPGDFGFAKECVEKAGAIARKIIARGIYHPDLHLGNVLYQNNGDVYLIDFDGAKVLKTDREKQAAVDKIAKRWSRSVRKWLGHGSDVVAIYETPFVNSLRG